MKKLIYVLFLLISCFALTSCQARTDYDIKSVAAFISIGIIIFVFIILGVYSNLLRDQVTNCDEFAANAKQLQKKQKWRLPGTNAPFSLTRVQFGLWTVIISCVYIYLSLFKGDCAESSINKTALVLMGICAGTAVVSAVIDKKEVNDNRPRHQNAPSQGFFIDILSGDSGISLHRFQNVAWTIIAIVVYLYKVSLIKTGCDLPELSDTLLALTGISSATYLVLKTKENDPAVANIESEPQLIQPLSQQTNRLTPVITAKTVEEAAG